MKRLEVIPTPEAIADSIANDTANRNDELIDLVKLIDSIEGPYSLLLDAPWGDGKTFFVRSLEEVLKSLNPHILSTAENGQKLARVTKELEGIETPYLPFYFNAWEHDFADDPISALFASMAVAFDAADLTKEHSTHKAIAAIIEAALAAAPIPAPFTKIAASVANQASNVIEVVTGESLIEAYEKRAKLRELIENLAENCIIEVANKLVIIIDELDRCRPDFAVRLLEQTKSLFQSENIVVVISADSLQLAHATAGLYGDGFDSQHFIERFFDLRLSLSPSEPYKVLNGCQVPLSGHNYDLIVADLKERHRLTIRDYSRIQSKLQAGRKYCDAPSDGSIPSVIMKCLFIPILTFIERDDTALFRSITSGQDFDALYEYGSRCPTFKKLLDRCLRPNQWPGSNGDQEPPTEEERKGYVRDLCILLYSTNQNSKEYYEASSRVSLPWGINKMVFRSLSFPTNERE